MRISLIAITALLLSLGTASAAAAAGGDPRYDGVATSSRYIRGFDGTRLAITVFRPTDHGKLVDTPLPVIVTQDRSQAGTAMADVPHNFMLQRGYVVVAQDRRGTGASFGVQTGFVNAFDAQDAASVIEWAARQPFSTGKIVAMGCSNWGEWQYLVATLRPRHLVAIAPACSSPQFFDHGVTTNGVPVFPAKARPFDGNCADKPAGGPAMPKAAPRPVADDRNGALLREAEKRRSCNAPMLGQYWLNMARDGLNPFTGIRPGLADSPITHWQEIRDSGIAVLQLGGWFDAAVLGQMQGQRLWGGKVVMGPWVHGNRPPPGSSFPDSGATLLQITADWFDHYAKRIDNGGDRAGVRYYTINAPAGHQWSFIDHWPGVDANNATFYLTADGLDRAVPPADGKAAVYPQQDVAWFDGKYQPLGHWWAGDMAAADARSLSETSVALAQDLDLTGTPSASLWITADTPDVNVWAVLEDVAPDGRSTYVTDGKLRASWRKIMPAPFPDSIQYWKPGYTSDIAPLTPGRPTLLTFEMFPISYVFERGHRLRVSIVTSLGKAYQAPPLNQGKRPTITLLRDAAHPSHVSLRTATGN